MTRDAMILGAGFSRAVSIAMPMTAELGRDVFALLRKRGVDDLGQVDLDGPQLERWLSRLAEPQPDLSAAKNASNHALFLMASEAVRDVIVARQYLAHEERLPWWLRRLLGVLHFSRPTVATFNYDTLMETALNASQLFDAEGRLARGDEAIRHMPPLRRRPAEGISSGTPRSETFRYLKLHGSIDTFWIPGDSSGASIGRWALPGRWGSPARPSDEDRRQVLPGTEAYIVPPAAAKSAFYANPLARELWRSAGEALADADRVIIMGYSLPLTDLVTSGMLSENVANSTSQIVVVDPNSQEVAGRLVELGVDPARIRMCGGGDCIARFAVELDESTEVQLADEFVPESRVVLGWHGAAPSMAISAVKVDEGGLVRLRADDAPWRESPIHAHELLDRGTFPRHIEVGYAGGQRARIVRASHLDHESSDLYLVLTPTAFPPH